MNKSYRELHRLKTFEERYEYLRINSQVGFPTFGFERYINQTLYKSRDWKQIRNEVILRDEGCDLGVSNRIIFGKIIIHHLNPISIEDIEQGNPLVFNLNNLICTSHNTHNAIHYGDASLLPILPIERRKGDTCPWMKI